MKTSIAFRILHQPIPFFIGLTASYCIFLGFLFKVILINKIIACIIRRIGCLTTFDTITRLFP